MSGAKRALIVGGGTGLGLSAAEALAACGARVFLTGRRAGALEAAAKRLGAACAGVMTGDATEASCADRVAEAAAEALGGIDCLVISAGATAIGSVIDAKLAEFRHVLDANLLPLFLYAQRVATLMPEAGGSIVVIASIAGSVPHAERLAYCAAKSGAIGMARQMALDLAPRRIRVNAVSPSLVLTDLTREIIGKADDPEATLAARCERHPIGRLGTAEEVGAAVAYLASDQAGWITGQDFRLDGGLSLRAASA